MFESVHRFISNPNPQDGFTLVMIIFATVIVGIILYRIDVFKNRRWFKASKMDVGTWIKWGTATGYCVGKIVSDTGAQLRIEVRGYSPEFNCQVTETILVPFPMASKMTWVTIDPDMPRDEIECHCQSEVDEK